MFKIKLRHVFTSLIIIFSSCKSSDKGNLPNSTGKPGTLIVVSDAAMQKELNTDLQNIFLRPVDTLSSEPFVEILKPDIEDFLKLFTNQKTVLVLVTASNYKDMAELLSPFPDETILNLINDAKGVIKSEEDLFAKHQHIIYLFGKDASDIKNKLLANKVAITEQLVDFELQDHSESLYADTSSNEKYYQILKDNYGIGVRIPGSFSLIEGSGNFYRFQMDTKEAGAPKTIGLIIHAYPYTDTSDFNYINIRSVRDSFCKRHIPGELPGTYMGTTESTRYPKRTRTMMKLNGYNTCKIKGWWTIKGLVMAGPFVRYVVHVPEKKLLLAFEGFIYRPDIKLKEGDLRLIEAIAMTIK